MTVTGAPKVANVYVVMILSVGIVTLTSHIAELALKDMGGIGRILHLVFHAKIHSVDCVRYMPIDVGNAKMDGESMEIHVRDARICVSNAEGTKMFA